MSIIRTLPFGESRIEVELPDSTRVIDLGTRGPTGTGGTTPAAADSEALIREAIRNPIDLPPLRETAPSGGRALIAFDDPTVTAPAFHRQVAIETLLEELGEAGVPEENVELICANALHRKWTRDELSAVLGQDLVDRFGYGERLTCHDAEDRDNLWDAGSTPEGYRVEVHRLVRDADVAIYVNSSCSGFSGGWKSVCVGLSTWASIKHTHTPDGMSMSTHKNRMHDVLNPMGTHLEGELKRKIFKVETVTSGTSAVANVWAGSVDGTRAPALEVIRGSSTPRRGAAEPADVVIYGVPRWSPYATFAGMTPILTLISSGLGYLGGWIEAVGKPGCTVIMATPCPEEWDMEHHPAHKEVWDRVLPESNDPYEISERFEDEFATNEKYIDGYRNGVAYHPVHAILATHPLKRMKHAGRIFVAGADDPRVPEHIGYQAFASVEDALTEAQRVHGAECSVVCVS